MLDLIKQMYPKETTLADIGITKVREVKILQAIAESYSVPQINPDKETMYGQITETFEPTPESIWEEIDMLGGEQQVASSKPRLQKFKHGKEVPQEAEIQYLKQHLLSQALVHHKHVM